MKIITKLGLIGLLGLLTSCSTATYNGGSMVQSGDGRDHDNETPVLVTTVNTITTVDVPRPITTVLIVSPVGGHRGHDHDGRGRVVRVNVSSKPHSGHRGGQTGHQSGHRR